MPAVPKLLSEGWSLATFDVPSKQDNRKAGEEKEI
jgi:hypothetical protein